MTKSKKTKMKLKPDTVLDINDLDEDVEFHVPHQPVQRKRLTADFATYDFVVKGKQEGDKNICAVRKFYQEDLQARMIDMYNLVATEMKNLNLLSGKRHFATFLGSVQCDEIMYFYYQPWHSCSLQSWLTNNHNQNQNQNLACQWMLCLVSALNTMHEMNITHGDLNPTNIMIVHDDDEENNNNADSIMIVNVGVGKICHTDYSDAYKRPPPVFTEEEENDMLMRLMVNDDNDNDDDKYVNDKTEKKNNDIFSLGRIFKKFLPIIKTPCCSSIIHDLAKSMTTNTNEYPSLSYIYKTLRRLPGIQYSCCCVV